MGWVFLGVAIWAAVVFAQYFRLTSLCHTHQGPHPLGAARRPPVQVRPLGSRPVR
jgi:hypothetical protein